MAVGAFLELRIICLTGCLAWGFSAPVVAELTPDGSLGNEASRVTPNVEVKGALADLIEGGATRGDNLFHSFAEFNVGELQRVYFANPSGIQTILTRVTGSNLSNILGTLGVDGSANLFLLNPNGIVFGHKARLDVAGSFVASTANSLVFGDGQEFSATSPEAPPLLTINITPGLQYGKYDPRSNITNAGNLAVGQDLTLAAGNLDLQGQLDAGNNLTLFGEDTVTIRDSVAQPFRLSAGGLLLIQGNQSIDIAAHNHVLSGLFAGSDLRLQSHNPIAGNAYYSAGGNVTIEQLDGLPGNLFSPHDPIILANGDVSLGNYTGASLHILAGGSVTVGDIEINSTDTADNAISPDNSNPFLASLANVTLSDEARTSVVIDGSSQPTLDIRAGIDWTLLGGLPGNTDIGNLAPNFGTAATSANIKIGDISIKAPNGLVLLTNQYQPNGANPSNKLEIGTLRTDDDFGGFVGNSGEVIIDYRGGIEISESIDASSGSGKAGDITVVTNDQLSLDGSFIISNTFGTEKGGDITIDTGSLLATGGAQIETSTFGQADAGKVTIVADDTVTFEGKPENPNTTGIFNNIEQDAIGNSGGISMTTGSLFMNDAFLQSRIKGQGNGGDVTIIADDQVIVDQNSNSILTEVDFSVIGSAGDISIDAESVTISNGARLVADTLGIGDAGNITITARDTVTIDGVNSDLTLASGLRSRVGRDRENPRFRNKPQAIGNGGDITIKGKSVFVTNGGQISAEIYDKGKAGNISIIAEDDVIFDGALIFRNKNRNNKVSSFSSIIFTRVRQTAEGDGGNVLIEGRSVSFTNGAVINSETRGKGNGGDVEIKARDRVLVDGVVLLDGVDKTRSITTGIFSNVRSNGDGNGGDIKIKVKEGSLAITGGARLQSGTQEKGNGGNVIITVDDQVLIDGVGINDQPSQILTGVDLRSTQGNGGKIKINANSIAVTDGGALDASTNSNGNGGPIDLTTNTLTVNGGVISSAAKEKAIGQASDITINTDALKVEDEGEITVKSEKGIAGNLDIKANSLLLDNGTLLAETQLSGGEDGANITLNVSDSIVMLNESLISAEASEKATGGNIDIDTDVLIAFPPTGPNGSDIIAKAAQGQGGEITIDAEDVRLIEERRAIPGNRTNDIDASSDSGPQGIVTINTGNLDPSRGLDQLPSNLTDPSSLIVASCPRSGKISVDELGEFIVTGRGGIPASPFDPIIGQTIIADWVTLDDQTLTEIDHNLDKNQTLAPSTQQNSQRKRIVEAQGWMIGPDGTIILTSFPTDTTSPPKPWYHYVSCRDL
ncbi:filamentous hemagglutinin N-terminal domain-containing protein [Moorena producens JHB]|uniref:Filamentous hemagglutinin N-terminal domain-containing protein n=1 Tax=Moorena producens (strain JHB) TaxID=1454205 RepID=A0A1D9G8G7_MOOP1|nr:filamentous hemagglutinin N-terminal domain-containing protein [Moorena producens]AOY83893.1 filamentous hemagglutinin N-terminal domain-containing protein [Moorena producens JHB]